MPDLLGTFKQKADDLIGAINRTGGIKATIDGVRRQMAASDQRRSIAKAKAELKRLDTQITEMITAVGVGLEINAVVNELLNILCAFTFPVARYLPCPILNFVEDGFNAPIDISFVGAGCGVGFDLMPVFGYHVCLTIQQQYPIERAGLDRQTERASFAEAAADSNVTP